MFSGRICLTSWKQPTGARGTQITPDQPHKSLSSHSNRQHKNILILGSCSCYAPFIPWAAQLLVPQRRHVMAAEPTRWLFKGPLVVCLLPSCLISWGISWCYCGRYLANNKQSKDPKARKLDAFVQARWICNWKSHVNCLPFQSATAEMLPMQEKVRNTFNSQYQSVTWINQPEIVGGYRSSKGTNIGKKNY